MKIIENSLKGKPMKTTIRTSSFFLLAALHLFSGAATAQSPVPVPVPEPQVAVVPEPINQNGILFRTEALTHEGRLVIGDAKWIQAATNSIFETLNRLDSSNVSVNMRNQLYNELYMRIHSIRQVIQDLRFESRNSTQVQLTFLGLIEAVDIARLSMRNDRGGFTFEKNPILSRMDSSFANTTNEVFEILFENQANQMQKYNGRTIIYSPIFQAYLAASIYKMSKGDPSSFNSPEMQARHKSLVQLLVHISSTQGLHPAVRIFVRSHLGPKALPIGYVMLGAEQKTMRLEDNKRNTAYSRRVGKILSGVVKAFSLPEVKK